MRLRTAADAYPHQHGRPDTGAHSIIDLLHAWGHPVPEPASGAPAGPPVLARVNHGRWIADCHLRITTGPWAGQRCHNAQYVHPDDPRFFCVTCHNAEVGGRWRPVTWPPDPAAIEATLEGLPIPEQNWQPPLPGKQGRGIGELHPHGSEPPPEGA